MKENINRCTTVAPVDGIQLIVAVFHPALFNVSGRLKHTYSTIKQIARYVQP